jgi:ribosomal protein L30E
MGYKTLGKGIKMIDGYFDNKTLFANFGFDHNPYNDNGKQIINDFKNTDSDYVLRCAKKLYAIRLLGSKCSKCEQDHPIVLDFHHLDPFEKEETISNIIRGNAKDCSLDALKSEVKKCIILCKNCHLEEHSVNNNISKIELLRIMGGINFCQRCGYESKDKVSSLQFHHRDPLTKLFAISDCYSNNAKSISFNREWDELVEELRKCVILCGNCHSFAHAHIERYERLKHDIVPKMNKWIKRQKYLKENLVLQNNPHEEKVSKRYERKHKPSKIDNPFGDVSNLSVREKIEKQIANRVF